MDKSPYLYYLINIVFESNPIDIRIHESININCNKISYSEVQFDVNNTELCENDVTLLHKVVKLTEKGEIPSKLISSDVPFLKLIHFFISEQYLKHPLHKDKYGRITSKSVDEKYLKFLEIPIVDILIDMFYKKLGIERKKEQTIILTSDFDFTNLWVKLGFLRSVKRLAQWGFLFKINLFRREFISWLFDRKKLIHNFILPSDLFDLNSKSVKCRKIAFWLMNYRHKGIDFKNDYTKDSFKEYVEILKRKDVSFGLHPTFGTANNKVYLESDIKHFKIVFAENPQLSRYHYLKFDYPQDFKILEKTGIKEDFSYCFPDNILFRGGRTFPIKPWLFEENRTIDVLSYPITLMDVVFKYYLHLDIDQAKKSAGEKLKLTLEHGSYCVLLWHNNYQYKHYEKENYQPELYHFVKKYITDYFENKDNS